MISESVPALSELDIKQFEALIARESVTWAGQELKMRDIRTMISARLEDMRKNLAGQIGTASDPLRTHEVRLKNGKTQVIIGRGDHARGQRYPIRRKSEPINVFVPAHIDTVALQTPDLLKLQPVNTGSDRMRGRGTYDMLGQALNNIALATEVSVPRGMNVFFAFTFDEERNSRGAEAVIDNWEWWNRIDVVLSSEIGHVPVKDKETRMPYIIGRRGRHKYHLVLTVDEEARGHFADAHVRSAGQAIGEAKYLLIDRFKHTKIIGTGSRPLMRSHPYFGDEKLEFGSDGHEDGGEMLLAELESLLQLQGDIRSQVASLVQKRKAEFELREQRSTPTTRADFYYSIQSVPGRRIEDSVREQRVAFDLIARHCEWEKHGISWSLTRNENETSYDAFEMPDAHPLNKIVEATSLKISGGGYPVRGPSVADENLYATSILARPRNKGVFRPYEGVISIPPLGDNAHRIDEWVSLQGLAKTRHALRLLIEDPEGLMQLRKIKRKSRI